MTRMILVGPHGMPSCPRSARPAPTFTPAPRVSMVSKNGKRLPLRAIPWRQLNRDFWSQGKTAFPQAESNAPRKLLAHEKPVEDMTLDELVATQNRDPLSESRRAWLNWGDTYSHLHGTGGGMLSLEGLADREGSIAETLYAKGIDAVPVATEDAPSLAVSGERDAELYGTPYIGLDPITQKQIDREQINALTGPIIRARMAQNDEGRNVIRTDRKLFGDELMRVMRSVKRTLVSTIDDGLDPRVAALARAMGFDTPDADDVRRDFLAPAPDIFHSSFEEPVASIAYEREDPAFICWRRRCTAEPGWRHSHVRVTRIHHRSTRRNKDELWHRRIFDVTAFELGTDGLVDPLVAA